MKSCEIFIEGIGAARIVEKLVQGGVPVLAARVQKKGVLVRVDSKDCEKVFAILRGSCYNGKKVRFAGLLRFLSRIPARAGLLVGAALFFASVLFCQSRVLRIEVTGSGAYYEAEVLRALSREGTGFFTAPPADPAKLTAEILSLPRVSFCSLSHAGGVLTIQVEVSDDAAPLAGGNLVSPVSGKVESLTVLAGTARVCVGDEVSAGDVLVENVTAVGETFLPVTVIASASVRYAVDALFSGSREEALAKAYLDYGEIEGLQIQMTGEEWRITGEAIACVRLNLG